MPLAVTSTAIIRLLSPAELELLRLRKQLALACDELTARERALDDLRSHLLSFEGRYIRQVGLLYKQLDEWEKKSAELNMREAAAAEFFDEGLDALSEAEDAGDEPDRETPAALKALFREVARRIHPDRAVSALDELHRTRLMAQANDAYLRRDAAMLRRMLHGFAPAAVVAVRVEDEIALVRTQIAEVMRDAAAAEKARAELAASELAALEASVIAATREGRDLLAEMAARVKGRIGLAMRQYELDMTRIKRPAKGFAVESLLSAETAPRRLRR